MPILKKLGSELWSTALEQSQQLNIVTCSETINHSFPVWMKCETIVNGMFPGLFAGSHKKTACAARRKDWRLLDVPMASRVAGVPNELSEVRCL